MMKTSCKDIGNRLFEFSTIELLAQLNFKKGFNFSKMRVVYFYTLEKIIDINGYLFVLIMVFAETLRGVFNLSAYFIFVLHLNIDYMIVHKLANGSLD